MSALTTRRLKATIDWHTARRLPDRKPIANEPSSVKNAPIAKSAAAAYGQPTAHEAMTCAEGTKASSTVTHRLVPCDQPRVRRPRNITREIAPSNSEAKKRIHCRFCTLAVCPYVDCSNQP